MFIWKLRTGNIDNYRNKAWFALRIGLDALSVEVAYHYPYSTVFLHSWIKVFRGSRIFSNGVVVREGKWVTRIAWPKSRTGVLPPECIEDARNVIEQFRKECADAGPHPPSPFEIWRANRIPGTLMPKEVRTQTLGEIVDAIGKTKKPPPRKKRPKDAS